MSLRDTLYRSPVMATRLKRYHAWPVLHQQTVGEHCARVANIYVEMFGLPNAKVFYYILNHDAGELLAGDVPFGGKDHVKELRTAISKAEAIGRKLLSVTLPNLSKRELAKIKIADLLEMHEFGMIEEAMGNRLASPITDETLTAALEKADEINLRDAVVLWVKKQGIQYVCK